MSIPEMATLVQEGLNVKMAIINNGFLGMVRQWQELMHDKRYSETHMWSPDFVKVAEAYGIRAFRAKTVAEARECIRAARAHDGPTLIEFVVESETNVFPMIQHGLREVESAHRLSAHPKMSRQYTDGH
jgi:acetolactate synthase-1/2/3 large subunit